MAKEERESLLLVMKEKEKIRSYYHEICPGCQVERQKEECPNPPWLRFFFIWTIALAAGVGLLLCQLFLYPIFERTFGPITISRVFAVLSIVLLSSYPFIAKLSGWRLTVLIDLASALKNTLSVSITTGLFLLQNRAVSQQQRGVANGISLCAMSFCKAIGPAAVGFFLSWGQTRQEAHFLPDVHRGGY